MRRKIQHIKVSIWTLALGYFAFYVPYSALTKALSNGLIPGIHEQISGFKMLPMVCVGTVVVLSGIIYLMGWHKYAQKKTLAGLKIPWPSNKWTIYSGMATAVIIMTTTLAYSFVGISIVFAALLMRGGVLLIAPLVDKLFRRRVYWYSWIALMLSFAALLLVFSEKGGYALSLIAGINIAAYLSGYVFRLQFMTQLAKSNDTETNYRFFVEEMAVAMGAILLIPAVLAIIGAGPIMMDLKIGFTSFAWSMAALPSLMIGGLYGCLYIFGTRIYLNQKENTFCIPINRCASLLAGVVASILMSVLSPLDFPSSVQLVSAGILILAILFLSYPEIKLLIDPLYGKEYKPINTYVFVCPGNTGRSPMAQSICNDLVINEISKEIEVKKLSDLEIISAGIDPNEGMPMAKDAILALKRLGFNPHAHVTSKLTNIQIRTASKIFCMSKQHHNEIVDLFPAAALKTHCIDPDDQLMVPHGKGVDAYVACAQRLQVLITNAMESQLIKIA